MDDLQRHGAAGSRPAAWHRHLGPVDPAHAPAAQLPEEPVRTESAPSMRVVNPRAARGTRPRLHPARKDDLRTILERANRVAADSLMQGDDWIAGIVTRRTAPEEPTMRRALPLVLPLPALAARGVALPNRTPRDRDPEIAQREDRPIEGLLVDVSVSKASGPAGADAPRSGGSPPGRRREANPDERIANVHLMNVFHSSDLLVRVAFEPYETGPDPPYHTAFLLAAEQPGDPDPGFRRSPAAGATRIPTRGESGALPALAVLHWWRARSPPRPYTCGSSRSSQRAELAGPVVDCVRDQIPDGERIEGIQSGWTAGS